MLRRDPFPIAVLVVMPLVIIAFFRPALALALFSEGFVHANGSEQAVPGVAVTFSFFIVGFVGLAFFRDRGWNTWDRLRGAASVNEIVTGKLLPIGLTALVQLVVLFGAGFLIFSFRINGSPATPSSCLLPRMRLPTTWCRQRGPSASASRRRTRNARRSTASGIER
jgi:ABC-2 type transport system permease protein